MSTNYEPCFATVPPSPQARWTLLREFISRWHEIELPLLRDAASAASDIESTLNRQLPESIREWIALARDLSERGHFGEVFRDQFEVTRISRLAITTLLLQGEQDIYWAIQDSYLNLPDPPVDSYWNGDANRFEFFERSAPTLTSFVLSHLIHFLGPGLVTTRRLDAAFIAELHTSFPVVVRFDNLQIFEMTNLIAVIREMDNEPKKTLILSFKGELSATNIPECLRIRLPKH